MYTIPVDFDVERLIGIGVDQISFSSNAILISFENLDYVNIQASFTISIKGEKQEHAEIYPVQGDMGFLNLLGKRITKLTLNADRDILSIDFEGEINLTLIGNEMYEAFTIKIGEKEALV